MSAAYLVFPRTHCEISLNQERSAKVTSPATTVLYLPGDVYKRRFLSSEGDRCDYFMVDAAVVSDLLALPADDPAATALGRWCPVAYGSPELYFAQRQLVLDVVGGRIQCALEVEERILAILGNGIRRHRLEAKPSVRPRRERRDRVEEVKAHFARNPCETPSLAKLAGIAHLSPASLCRSFSAATGSTLHQYMLTNKVLASLDLLLEASKAPISDIATHLGFSHHSHFTDRFVRLFGLPPSEFRRRALGSTNRDPSRRLRARRGTGLTRGMRDR